jgi:hypothetical protein
MRFSVLTANDCVHGAVIAQPGNVLRPLSERTEEREVSR